MKNIYEEITGRIIAEMEQGKIPWHKPWVAAGAAISHSTGKSYSLLNQLILGKPGEYITFKQCQNEGGRVKRGAKSRYVVFWKRLKVTETDENNVEKEKTVFVLRYYNVFHIDDCEGIKPKYAKPVANPAEPHEAAQKIMDEYIAREGIHLVISPSDRAFYRPSEDMISLPEMGQFAETEEFYSTAFHEMTHSTGHESRLNRLCKGAGFGSENYSKEELVAEIGAATLVNRVGLESEKSFRNSAAYVQGWLSALKNDKRLIVSAAGKAEKAVALILGEQADAEPAQEAA